MTLTDSLQRDFLLMQSGMMSRKSAARLIASKYRHHLRRISDLGASNRLTLCSHPYLFQSAADPGFLQMVLIDTHEYLSSFGLIGQSGLTTVDVGAHLGETAIALGLSLSRPRIICFEPNPPCALIAKENTRHLDVTLHAYGLADAPGVLPFRVAGNSTANGTFIAAAEGPSQEAVGLRVLTGDAALAEIGLIDLMKIDVEGYEIPVLNGLVKTLRRVKRLVLEVPTDRGRISNLTDLDQILSPAGLHIVAGSGQLARGSANATFTNDTL